MAASRQSCQTHCLFLSWICLFLIQGAYCAKIRWDMQDADWDPRREGTDIVMTCVARQLKNAFSAVSLEKSVPEGSWELVVTNQVVEEKFRELRYRGRMRYSTTYDLLQNHMGFIGTLSLTIKAVQSEDAGYYRCRAERAHTEIRTLAVRVPIEDIYMRSFIPNDTSVPIPDGTIVSMEDNERGGIACSVVLRTQFIQPVVTLSAAGRDITPLFTESAPERVYGTIRPMFMYQFSYHTARPNADLHEETVVCSAYSVGFEGQRGKAIAVLDIEFRPIISCGHYEYYAQVGGSVTMLCAVKANPRAQIIFKFGFYLTDNVYNLTRTYMKEGQYGFTRTESGTGFSNVTFTISPVRKSQYQYSYKLEAVNRYGSTSATFILIEGINGMRLTSSAAKITELTELYTLLTFITLYILHFGKR